MGRSRVKFADDDKQSIRVLFMLRLPSLVVGMVLGVLLSFATSRFEEVLEKNVSVAFFIPFIVYVADAVGTQTQNIFTRDLRTRKANFRKYLGKELALGVIFGAIFGALAAVIVVLWFKSTSLALAVSLSLFGAVALAPVIALVVTEFLNLEHTDPATGAGPITTVIQDTVSVIIYGFIASAIIL